jgi:hypothetical protein
VCAFADTVCASNGKIYSSACVFQKVMCETEQADVEIEMEMSACGGGDGGELSA